MKSLYKVYLLNNSNDAKVLIESFAEFGEDLKMCVSAIPVFFWLVLWPLLGLLAGSASGFTAAVIREAKPCGGRNPRFLFENMKKSICTVIF